MNEKTRESLSALLDDEADDLELRRILAQTHDDELVAVWQRYHQVKAGLNSEEAAWAQIDLRIDIAKELDAPGDRSTSAIDAGGETKPAAPGKKHMPWWGSAAIAASVAFAVIFTVQTVGFNDAASPQLAESPDKVNAVGVEPVNEVASSGSVEFSREHEQRLNAYLMKHAGNVALNGGRSIVPYARLTSYEPEAAEVPIGDPIAKSAKETDSAE